MVIRVGSRERYILFVLLMLIVCTMLLLSRVIIFSGVIFGALCVFFNRDKYKLSNRMLQSNLVKVSALQVALLFLMFTLQFVVLGLSVNELVLAFVIETAIFIAPILAVLMSQSFNNLKVYLKTFKVYAVGFSALYLGMILVNGLPEGRDSALGYVSSNFSASLLYLMFPVFLYSLLNREIHLSRKESRSTAAALFLSLLVILTTGSRTAISALLIIMIFIFFYSTKNLKASKWLIRILVVAFATGIVLYYTSQQVNTLIERAFSMFNDSGRASIDVRTTVVWMNAYDNISRMNPIFGLGTNITSGIYEIPAHNIWLETLMTCGIFGIVLWLIMVVSSIVILLRTHNRTKIYFGGMALTLYFFTGFFQPFYSTGYMCGLVTWLSFYAIALNER